MKLATFKYNSFGVTFEHVVGITMAYGIIAMIVLALADLFLQMTTSVPTPIGTIQLLRQHGRHAIHVWLLDTSRLLVTLPFQGLYDGMMFYFVV